MDNSDVELDVLDSSFPVYPKYGTTVRVAREL